MRMLGQAQKVVRILYLSLYIYSGVYQKERENVHESQYGGANIYFSTLPSSYDDSDRYILLIILFLF